MLEEDKSQKGIFALPVIFRPHIKHREKTVLVAIGQGQGIEKAGVWRTFILGAVSNIMSRRLYHWHIFMKWKFDSKL